MEHRYHANVLFLVYLTEPWKQRQEDCYLLSVAPDASALTDVVLN